MSSEASPRVIGIVAYDGALLLNVAATAEVFASANRECGREPYRTVLLSTYGGPVTTSCGITLATVALPPPAIAAFDTVLVAGGSNIQAASRDAMLARWLTAIEPGVRRVGALGNGAFVLAAAGLLDGRRCVTHWLYADALRREHPAARVESDAMFVRDGKLFTSAGATAGIDLALHLVEEDLGPAIAQRAARSLVVFMKRPGGQSQFSAQLIAQEAMTPRVRQAAAWLNDNLHRPLTIADGARAVSLGERTLSRLFAREFGLSPGRYLERARIEAARRLLTETDLPADKIARRTGFGSGEHLGRVFRRHLAMTPRAFRARFKADRKD